MNIYEEIFFIWHSINFQNSSIHQHLVFRYCIELFLMCHYYTTRSFAHSLFFFKECILYSYFSRSLYLWWESSLNRVVIKFSISSTVLVKARAIFLSRMRKLAPLSKPITRRCYWRSNNRVKISLIPGLRIRSSASLYHNRYSVFLWYFYCNNGYNQS